MNSDWGIIHTKQRALKFSNLLPFVCFVSTNAWNFLWNKGDAFTVLVFSYESLGKYHDIWSWEVWEPQFYERLILSSEFPAIIGLIRLSIHYKCRTSKVEKKYWIPSILPFLLMVHAILFLSFSVSTPKRMPEQNPCDLSHFAVHMISSSILEGTTLISAKSIGSKINDL